MKSGLIFLSIILSSHFCFSQQLPCKNWLFSVDAGIQENDNRKRTGDKINGSGFPTFGTYQVAASLSRKIAGNNEFCLFAGIGLSSELNTTFKRIDQHYGGVSAPDNIQYSDRYFHQLIQAPVRIKYSISDRFSLGVDILPQFSFLASASNVIGSNHDYVWKEFDYYSTELNAGLDYHFSDMTLSLKYRVFQVKKIDRILFQYHHLNSPRDLETVNPVKFWISSQFQF